LASVGISGGDKLDAYLRAVAKRIGQPATLRVGFLEDATYPDGTSVATVATAQNFGAPAAGIPPRPFFSNMVRDKSPDWPESLGNLLESTDYNATKALELMGEGIAGQLRQAIVDTNSPPLAPATIARKGFAKPLVDTSVMLNSVSSEVEKA
jgi:hypothetical protein